MPLSRNAISLAFITEDKNKEDQKGSDFELKKKGILSTLVAVSALTLLGTLYPLGSARHHVACLPFGSANGGLPQKGFE